MKQKRPSRKINNNNKLPSKKKNKGGRPSKYLPIFVDQAYQACSQMGDDDSLLAKLFGVTVDTITKWKKRYPEFLLSVYKGKREFDTNQLEVSYLKEAMGYEYTETDIVDGPKGRTVSVHQRWARGNGSNAKNWLANRRPKDWNVPAPSEKEQPIQHIEQINILSGLSIDDIKKLRDSVRRGIGSLPTSA